jgi:hypothetical protein
MTQNQKNSENSWNKNYKNEFQDELSTEECVDTALEEYIKQAQDLWNDSCTSQRKTTK